MTKLWYGDVEGARKALLDVLDDTALADAKLAGWYSVWLAASYEAENDGETAIAHYKKARSRLSPRLTYRLRVILILNLLPRARRPPFKRFCLKRITTARRPWEI
jgi:hypothetical protein